MRTRFAIGVLGGAIFLAGCQTKPVAPPATKQAETPVPAGHAIIVAGQRFNAGLRVVTWEEPSGFNAYLVPTPSPDKPREHYENHGARRLPNPAGSAPTEPQASLNLAALRGVVDQLVLHYDGRGSSRQTFGILQKRALSVHFLLDVDGTVYQTLDLRERAYHATIANSRSIGIEIANPGAYPPDQTKTLDRWYRTDAHGETVLRSPPELGPAGTHTPHFEARPARPKPVRGVIHGQTLVQYDFTPEQYATLGKLIAALHRVLPKIALDFPRDAGGQPLTHVLSETELEKFHGIIGHWHIQANKVDPGPALQWDRVLTTARQETESDKVNY